MNTLNSSRIFLDKLLKILSFKKKKVYKHVEIINCTFSSKTFKVIFAPWRRGAVEIASVFRNRYPG
jgi:hypothetical protein